MLIACPACAVRYRLDSARFAGKRISIRCPGCRLVFPLVPARDAAPAQPRVLLATGNPGLAAALTAQCRRSRLACRVCADGTEAIRQLTSGLPETVLLDVALTGRYAFDVIAFIRQRVGGKAVKILLLSSSFRTGSFVAPIKDLHGADDSIACERLLELSPQAFARYLSAEPPAPGSARPQEIPGEDIEALSSAQWNQATSLAKVIAADIVLRYQDLLEESARTGVLGKALVQGLAKGRALFAARMGEEIASGHDFVGAALAACLQGQGSGAGTKGREEGSRNGVVR